QRRARRRGACRGSERRLGLATLRDRPIREQPPHARGRTRQHRLQRALRGGRSRHARAARQHDAALHTVRRRVQAARSRGAGERRRAADANAALGRSDETRDYTALSGTLGVVYRPAAAVALTANLGRAWRAPTLFELFANGPHLGEARYEIGDPGLKPEAGTNMDVGVRWQGARVRVELAGYRNA